MELDYQSPPPTAMDAAGPQEYQYQQYHPQQQQYPQQQQQQQTVFSAPPQQQQPRILGLVVPGRAARTDFVPVDATGTKFALTLTSPGDLSSPLTLVNELVCYLEAPLPAGHGLSIYWQLATSNCTTSSSGSGSGRSNGNNHNTSNMQPQQQSQQPQQQLEQISGFEWLGSLTLEHPSDIFRTGWSEHDQFLALPPQRPATITIGISIEPLDNIRNLNAASAANGGAAAKRPLVAQKIARDLYNFMQSFDTGGAVGNQQMVVPQNIFERWWKRFEAKSKRDPNFFLKTED
mmetsp:Transcript_109895/g.164349  ORF Transcript_109895/g.164349 Transcript_109895/m.164349 type:complete len:290 (+) Transcript_109895:88-957(+)